MNTKNIRIDWYYRDAQLDFQQLDSPAEIGVLMQIINMIYHHQGPILYNLKHIAQVCACRPSTCESLVDGLVEKRQLYFDEQGRLSQKRCERELEATKERRKNYSKSGKKGAESRWQNQQNQSIINDEAIQSDLASININSENNTSFNRGEPASNGRLLKSPLKRLT